METISRFGSPSDEIFMHTHGFQLFPEKKNTTERKIAGIRYIYRRDIIIIFL